MQRFRLASWWILSLVVGLVPYSRASAQVTLDPAWPENPRMFGDDDATVGESVQQTQDGGYVVAGRTGYYQAYLIKLDAQGNLDSAWDPNPKTLGGNGGYFPRCVRQTRDGGYIVAGGTWLSSGETPGRFWVVKLDPQGNLDPSWDPNPRTFGGPNNDGGHFVQTTKDGGYIVAGATTSFGAGSSDVYLIKLDAQGNLDPAWDPNPKTFGGPKQERAFCVQQTSDGGYIVAGITNSFGAGEDDAYILKLDSAGTPDPTWASNPVTFGGDRDEYAYFIQETTDGGYVASGFSRSYGGTDVYLIKLDARGNLDSAWDPNPKTLGGNRAYSVQQTIDDGYVVAGYTSTPGPAEFEVYLSKLDSRGNFDPAWDPNPRSFGIGAVATANSLEQTSDGGFVVVGSTDRYPGRESAQSALVLKLAPARHFLRGDCNADGSAEGVPDAVSLLSYNFAGGDEPPCLAACDADGDGKVTGTVTDAVYILNHFFVGGPALAPPYPECGAGQLWTDGPLTCETEPPCP